MSDPLGGGAGRRVIALVKKECLQILRDPSSIAVGVVLPVVMILLFGYGLSLDVKHVATVAVLESPDPVSMDLAAAFRGSSYFDVELGTSYPEAERLLRERKVDAILRIRSDFARQLALGDARAQLVVNGVDANRARIIQGYAEGVVSEWALRASAANGGRALPPVSIEPRTWFNPTTESRLFLVPGCLVLVMTLIGALMTALVVAREWERGTLEALFVTPVRASEILLGKTVPYFLLGLMGLSLCLLAGRYLFHVPMRGSLSLVVLVSALYLLVALGIGLVISSATKNQFLASQLVLAFTFMPAFMLSGFVYDLGNMPVGCRAVSYFVPARYYVALLQTLFLAGDVWSVIVPNVLVLALMATVLLVGSRGATRKRIA